MIDMDPRLRGDRWIPAFAGMTAVEIAASAFGLLAMTFLIDFSTPLRFARNDNKMDSEPARE